jgi:hypothetical protein
MKKTFYFKKYAFACRNTTEVCSAERALAIVRMRLPLNGSASYSLAAEL